MNGRAESGLKCVRGTRREGLAKGGEACAGQAETFRPAAPEGSPRPLECKVPVDYTKI